MAVGPPNKQNKTVLLVQSSSALDGSAHSGLLLADGLRDAGFRTHVAFASEGPIIDRYAAAGHQTHIVPHDNWLRRGRTHQFIKDLWTEWSKAEALEAVIKDVQADLVYLNTVVSFAGAMAAHHSGCPCIWHLREMHATDGGEMHAPGWAMPLVRWLIRKYASALVVNSKATARSLLGGVSERETVIPNAAGNAFFEEERTQGEARSALGLSADPVLIGVPGTLRPMKGHPFFLHAVAPLLKSHWNVRVVITGGGRESFVRDLQALVRRCGIAGRVNFLGWVEDMPAFYRACDLTCIPSRAEPFGRTVIESFATGTPVVATAVGGMRENIESESTGLLVPYGDGEKLRVALRRLLTRPELRTQLKTRARRVAEERYCEAVYKDRIATLVAAELDDPTTPKTPVGPDSKRTRQLSGAPPAVLRRDRVPDLSPGWVERCTVVSEETAE